jgi:hypothetical protein
VKREPTPHRSHRLEVWLDIADYDRIVEQFVVASWNEHLRQHERVFDPGKMNQDRSGANADRILVAQLTGEARHRARWRPLTEEEEAAALAELRALASGRADLLAQVAGIFEGTSEGELDEPLARSAAQLCRKAGADIDAIPAWIEEGRRRSANARRPPFSG